MNDVADTRIAELERRVEALEAKVANTPPPVDPVQPPSLKDISLPIPNVETVVTTAKATWAIFEMLAEIRWMLVMLIDRRYHMGWLTRLLTIGLVVFILLSHFVWPFARLEMVLSPIWDKLIDLFVGLILFMVLHIETRRYKGWRGGRS